MREYQCLQSFGSFAAFKEQFIVTTLAQFGSSWVWLVKDKDGKLKVHATKDAGTPIRGTSRYLART
jgi:Fe-Mn family superoxide dismutase